ncbi:hypothetical protein JW948_07495 [bacterium]|nr:hypothetical protein [bacterium]
MRTIRKSPGSGLVLALFFSALAFRCSFKNPEAPTWDVDYVFAFINETYTMQELIDDEKKLILGGDGTVFYVHEQKFDTLGVDEFMDVGKVDTTGEIPVIPFQDTTWHELTLNESVIVKDAELESGNLRLNIQNNTDVKLDMTVILPFLFDETGEKYAFHVENLAPNQIKDKFEDLQGWRLRPRIENGKNVVKYGILATFEGTPESVLDFVTVKMSITDMTVSSFQGWLDDMKVPLAEVKQDLDLPEELDGMRVGAVKATLNIFNTFESLPGKVDLEIRGVRENGATETASMSQLDLVTGDNPINLVGLDNVINLYPKYLEIQGEMQIGGGYDPDHMLDIKQGDYILATAMIQIPLVFEFPPNLVNDLPVDTLDLNEDDDPPKEGEDPQDKDNGKQLNEIIRDNVNYAGLLVFADNHFPVGGKIMLIFSNLRGDSTIYDPLLRHPTDVVKEIDLRPGTVGGGAGTKENPNIVIAPSANESNLVLEKDELRLFESPEVYFGMQITLYPTLDMVKVNPEDYITVRGRMQLSLNTKLPDEDEDEEGGAQ